jgi:hypothetical protein
LRKIEAGHRGALTRRASEHHTLDRAIQPLAFSDETRDVIVMIADLGGISANLLYGFGRFKALGHFPRNLSRHGDTRLRFHSWMARRGGGEWRVEDELGSALPLGQAF